MKERKYKKEGKRRGTRSRNMKHGCECENNERKKMNKNNNANENK